MEFREVVRKRRMVRNYVDRSVPEDVVERVVAAGRSVPSAGFSQGQRFIVVTDPSKRRTLAELAGEERYVAQGFDPWMSRAPVHIVVCFREDDYHERYREPDKLTDTGREIDWPVPYWWVDAGAAMMMLLLAAVDEGLGAGFFGAHRLDGIRDALGIPRDVTSIGVVTVGYPAPDQPSGSLERGHRAASEVVHRGKWR